MKNQNQRQCGHRNGTYVCQRELGHSDGRRRHAAIVVHANRPLRYVWEDSFADGHFSQVAV